MEITVVKEFTFEAAHFLPGHPGKCANLHGHSYRLQVGVRGKVDSTTGMVMDFGKLKRLVEEIIVDHLDHRCLNVLEQDGEGAVPHLPNFPRRHPTAELMVEWIVGSLNDFFMRKWEGLIILTFVRLYETTTSYAEWRSAL